MELYLIRHGIAAERGTYADDDQRPLTATGERRSQRVAQRLLALGLHFDLLQSSPLVRARQTAVILQQEGLASQVAIAPELAPEGSLTDWLQRLPSSLPSDQQWAIVGHQPDLGLWAEQLVWGTAQDKLILKKAGLIGLQFASNRPTIGAGSLFWLTPPRLLL
ncbi:phosphohistidine phosphatase SixA [Synechococcus elongatus]|uniref:Phosphohistidine phosphatase SixA n=1 Tax=Synechococcus elongatus PCC 11801 TaxID=2219813 RepID=A0AAN1QQA0_SYNEL|nr:phosphohistidine phosphatase SixA [Synechococcus elongatus]AZB73546.1 phosphohistidine phosphatase SixA [Synechococcus elongatus PCC 11801]